MTPVRFYAAKQFKTRVDTITYRRNEELNKIYCEKMGPGKSFAFMIDNYNCKLIYPVAPAVLAKFMEYSLVLKRRADIHRAQGQHETFIFSPNVKQEPLLWLMCVMHNPEREYVVPSSAFLTDVMRICTDLCIKISMKTDIHGLIIMKINRCNDQQVWQTEDLRHHNSNVSYARSDDDRALVFRNASITSYVWINNTPVPVVVEIL